MIVNVNDGLQSSVEARPGGKARDAARTRARILASAQTIFSAHGYADAGLREIASDAGINVALVARYFGSKEKLFEAALDGMLGGAKLWPRQRREFGRSLVSMFVDDIRMAINPLPMLMQAATDPVAQSVALKLLQSRILVPLAEWLGPPHADTRAAQILALCAGFFTYRIMLPLAPFSGSLDPAARHWLETTLQDIVDSGGGKDRHMR